MRPITRRTRLTFRKPSYAIPAAGRPIAVAAHGIDALMWALALICLAFCLRAGGAPYPWIPLATAPVVVRFFLCPGYRQRVVIWTRLHWNRVAAYSADGATIPWLATGVFVVLPAALVYLANNRGMGSGDTVPVMPTTISLVRHGDWNLDEYVVGPASGQLPYYVRQTATGIYSSYPGGMVVFALPVVGAAHLVGANLLDSMGLEKWTASMVAASAMGLFFLTVLRLVPPPAALAITIILAFASTMYSTVGQGLWQHGGTVFWSLVALLVEFQAKDKNSISLGTALQGLACGMMLACRLTAGVFIVPFGLWIFARSPRRAVAVTALGLLAYAPWAWLYHSLYGSILGPSVGMLQPVYWADNVLPGLLGVLISPARGLIIYQPWVLLSLAHCVPSSFRHMAKENRVPAGWQLFCWMVIGLHITLISAWGIWWGGHCWGSRLLADVMPLLALVSARPIAALWHHRWGSRLILALALFAFFTHVMAVHFRADDWDDACDIDNHTEQLWSWSNPPFLARPRP